MEIALKCPFFWADILIEAGRMLHVFAKNRGMISGSGMPNYAEAAKFILKKYVSGELLYAALPLKESVESYPESIKVGPADRRSASTTECRTTTNRPRPSRSTPKEKSSTSKKTS